MVGAWLTIDLRNDICAVGLLQVTDQGIAQWYSEKTLTIYVSPDTEDSRSVADLAFFRQRTDKVWKPSQRHVLEDPRLVEYEKTPRLMREKPERLLNLLRVTLAPMLGQSLANYSNVPLLVLLDDAAPEPAVIRLFEATRREAIVKVIPGPSGLLEPFALWDANLVNLPLEGAEWKCAVAALDAGRDLSLAGSKEGAPIIRRYVWRNFRFSVTTARATQTPGNGLPHGRSQQELERVGAAMYALLWRERLMKVLDTDANTLQQELARKQDLLDKLRSIYGQLTQRGEPAKL